VSDLAAMMSRSCLFRSSILLVFLNLAV